MTHAAGNWIKPWLFFAVHRIAAAPRVACQPSVRIRNDTLMAEAPESPAVPTYRVRSRAARLLLIAAVVVCCLVASVAACLGALLFITQPFRRVNPSW